MNDLRSLIDGVSKLYATLASAEALRGYRALYDSALRSLELCKNTLTNAYTAIEALLKYHGRLEGTVALSTLANALNRLVEARNIFTHLRDDLRGLEGLNSAVSAVNGLASKASSCAMVLSLLTLSLLSRAENVDRNVLGKIAAAVASSLLASVLSLNDPEARALFTRCFIHHVVVARAP